MSKTGSVISDLKEWYLGRLSKSAVWFIAHLDKNKIPRPKTLQEIPPLAKEMLTFMGYPEPSDTYTDTKGNVIDYKEANPAKEIVQMALETAKQLNLVRPGMELPLRRVWYAYAKAALERGLMGYVYSKKSEKKHGQQREPLDGDYYSGFSDIIKNDPSLWYDTYGVKNSGKLTYVPSASPYLGDMFEPIMLGVEKTSYFQVLENMAKMLGLSLYAAGGQSSVSASEEIMKRIDPIMKQKKKKHLHIYGVTDFDPAGYSIAKNIYEHSKIFIERFGGKADYERLAPLPKHYTDTELEQGLYTIKQKWAEPSVHTFTRGKRKGETEIKGHWGYNHDRKTPLKTGVLLGGLDAIKDREDEGKIKFKRKRLEYKKTTGTHREGDPILDRSGNEQLYISQGLEIESLPEEPLESILKNPPSTMPTSYSGIARMRFILFDDIIERHGLDEAFKFLISLKNQGSYTGDNLVGRVIDVKNAEEIDEIVSSADEPFWQLHTDLEKWIKSYIENERKDVSADIDAWIDDVIQKYTNQKHSDYNKDKTKELIVNLKDSIYEALASNENSIKIRFPEIFSIDKIKHYSQLDEDYYKGIPIEKGGYSYNTDFKITIPDDIIKNIKPIANFAKCIDLNAQAAVDYLKELEKKLEAGEHIFDKLWEIPPVKGCIIDDDDNITFSEGGEVNPEQKQEVERLKQEIEELKAGVADDEYYEIAEERKERIEELQDTLEAAEGVESVIREELGEADTKIDNLEDTIDDMEKEFDEEKQKFIEDIDRLKQEIIFAQKTKASPEEIEKYKEQLEECREQLTVSQEWKGKHAILLGESIKLKTDLAKAKKSGNQPKINRLERELKTTTNKLKDCREQLKKARYKPATLPKTTKLSPYERKLVKRDPFRIWTDQQVIKLSMFNERFRKLNEVVEKMRDYTVHKVKAKTVLTVMDRVYSTRIKKLQKLEREIQEATEIRKKKLLPFKEDRMQSLRTEMNVHTREIRRLSRLP